MLVYREHGVFVFGGVSNLLIFQISKTSNLTTSNSKALNDDVRLSQSGQHCHLHGGTKQHLSDRQDKFNKGACESRAQVVGYLFLEVSNQKGKEEDIKNPVSKPK